jgi:hypothetical protein
MDPDQAEQTTEYPKNAEELSFMNLVDVGLRSF